MSVRNFAPVIRVHRATIDKDFWRDFFKNLRKAEKVLPFAGRYNNLHTRLHNRYRAVYARPHARDRRKALISIQAAFTCGVPGNIIPVVTGKDTVRDAPDTVAFYSISTWDCRVGGLGAPFLRDVVKLIKQENPAIETFVTLSPITGFRDWVLREFDQDFLDRHDVNRTLTRSAATLKEEVRAAGDGLCVRHDPHAKDTLDEEIMKLAALFVLGETRKDFNKVAKFHLGNGAQAFRLCIGANDTPAGRRDSFGLMMNYLYVSPEYQADSAAYKANGKRPFYSPSMARLIGENPKYVP